jgi:hypothetical protein
MPSPQNAKHALNHQNFVHAQEYAQAPASEVQQSGMASVLVKKFV